MKNSYKRIPAVVIAAFAFGSNAVLANNLSKEDADKIAKQCDEAAAEVNTNHQNLVLFRTGTPKVGRWWCAVTDREGTLLAIRSSDTQENGCTKTSFSSDAARLSEWIAIGKAWTSSFSNDEVAVDSRAAGLNSRIDQGGPPAGNLTGGNDEQAPLWGVWATNLLRHSERASGYTCGKRHFGVVPFAGGVPVYDCGSGKLVGGIGASGDSVDSDDRVARNAVEFAGFCTSP